MLDPNFCDGAERNDWFLFYAGDLPERLTDALLIITSRLNRLENDGSLEGWGFTRRELRR
jgi:hypothetical protein